MLELDELYYRIINGLGWKGPECSSTSWSWDLSFGLSMYSPGEGQPGTCRAATGIETLHQRIIFHFTEILFDAKFIPRNLLNLTFRINL